jgi:hypothetical protein
MTAAVPTSAPRRTGPALTGARARHLVRRALAAEAANWRSLDRVLFGRRRVPAGASPHGYDRPVRTVLVIFLVLSIVEVPVVDLLVHPWPAVRFPLLALGIWGVLTVLGLLCGYLSRLDLHQGTVTVSRVRIAVDDPAAFLDAVRTHIP